MVSWIQTYYPQKAKDAAGKKASDLTLVQHCLKKWRGLREEVLIEHELVRMEEQILPQDTADTLRFAVNDKTCALCLRYNDEAGSSNDCSGCPLEKHLGHPCDASDLTARSFQRLTPDELVTYPYMHWHKHGDPEPMITALEKTEKQLLEKGQA